MDNLHKILDQGKVSISKYSDSYTLIFEPNKSTITSGRPLTILINRSSLNEAVGAVDEYLHMDKSLIEQLPLSFFMPNCLDQYQDDYFI